MNNGRKTHNDKVKIDLKSIVLFLSCRSWGARRPACGTTGDLADGPAEPPPLALLGRRGGSPQRIRR